MQGAEEEPWSAASRTRTEALGDRKEKVTELKQRTELQDVDE